VAASNATQPVVITDLQDYKTYTLTTSGGNQSVTTWGPNTYTATATGVNGATTASSVNVNVPADIPTVNNLQSLSGMAQHLVNSDDVDPTGAVGTYQYLEYVNVYYQAYNKATGHPVWPSDQGATTPWKNSNPPLPDCANISLDMVVLFDHLAKAWVIGGHTAPTASVPYSYCIAVSNVDDLSSTSLAWYTYEIPLDNILGTNSSGVTYQPDWPKLGTWPDAYYLTMDLIDTTNQSSESGIVACALDRANMLTGGAARAPQCFTQTSPLSPISDGVYLGHSLIPADVDGSTPPPAGRDEFMVSIQNPINDGATTTSSSFNLWDFHVDWNTPANSTFTQSSIAEGAYTPGCYILSQITQTICVPEPGALTIGQHIDSVGDRFMPRFSYRNFLGTFGYESLLVSHTVQVGPGVNGTANGQQTGIRAYELRSGGTGTPVLYQDGTISIDQMLFRFLPSIAQDSAGNTAVGYSLSNSLTNPGIAVSVFNLPNPYPAVETVIPLLQTASEEETSGNGDGKWGSYSSMTIDPADDCTFWYVNEYFVPPVGSATIPTWQTQISSFTLSGCTPTP
jgi:hypothetical protein